MRKCVVSVTLVVRQPLFAQSCSLSLCGPTYVWCVHTYTRPTRLQKFSNRATLEYTLAEYMRACRCHTCRYGVQYTQHNLTPKVSGQKFDSITYIPGLHSSSATCTPQQTLTQAMVHVTGRTMVALLVVVVVVAMVIRGDVCMYVRTCMYVRRSYVRTAVCCSIPVDV